MIIFALCPQQTGPQNLIHVLVHQASPGRQPWQRAKILITATVSLVSLRMPDHPASLTSDAPLALLFSPAAFGRASARWPGPSCFRPFTHNSLRSRLLTAHEPHAAIASAMLAASALAAGACSQSFRTVSALRCPKKYSRTKP